MTDTPELDPSAAHDLARIDAAAGLLYDRCPHCNARLEVVAETASLPVAVGVTHEAGCPDWIPDWPA